MTKKLLTLIQKEFKRLNNLAMTAVVVVVILLVALYVGIYA
jgi:hypothetical protein